MRTLSCGGEGPVIMWVGGEGAVIMSSSSGVLGMEGGEGAGGG